MNDQASKPPAILNALVATGAAVLVWAFYGAVFGAIFGFFAYHGFFGLGGGYGALFGGLGGILAGVIYSLVGGWPGGVFAGLFGGLLASAMPLKLFGDLGLEPGAYVPLLLLPVIGMLIGAALGYAMQKRLRYVPLAASLDRVMDRSPVNGWPTIVRIALVFIVGSLAILLVFPRAG